MTITQISQAKQIAASDADLTTNHEHLLYGCALPDFKEVIVGVSEVAKLLREFLLFDGSGFDETLMNECGLYHALRHKVRIA